MSHFRTDRLSLGIESNLPHCIDLCKSTSKIILCLEIDKADRQPWVLRFFLKTFKASLLIIRSFFANITEKKRQQRKDFFFFLETVVFFSLILEIEVILMIWSFSGLIYLLKINKWVKIYQPKQMRLFKEHTRNKNREALRLRTATEEEVITFMSNLTTLRRMSCGPSLQPPGEEYYGTDARSPPKLVTLRQSRWYWYRQKARGSNNANRA